MTLYVDGVSRGKRTLAAAQYAPSVAPVRIGALLTNNAPFEGTLEDVRLYTRALRRPGQGDRVEMTLGRGAHSSHRDIAPRS